MIQHAQPFATYQATTGASYALVNAHPSPKLLALRLTNGGYRYDDSQLEKRCSHCREYWPADTEFFYPAKGQAEEYEARDEEDNNCAAAIRARSNDASEPTERR